MGSDTRTSKLVIVSGRSGSGKSTALHVLEDAGFYCIDNLPGVLLPELVTQAESRGDASLQRMAVSIDARNMASSLAGFAQILLALPRTLTVEVIYLDADDATLIKRFSETRRKHPLSNSSTSLNEAIAAERALLAPIAARAALSIDTSQMSLHDLRDLVSKTVVADGGAGMVVLFESFGFKRGIPIDADIVFDLRCLPNPHWVPHLRQLSGKDALVIRFLEQSPEVGEMLNDIAAYLEKWLPRFANSNRSYMTVALGCTGGQHRSVYMCERLLERFGATMPGAQVRHRELNLPLRTPS
ncbi:MAG: RNase adapter RapZ [Gammaproteobacteria bacterium]|nr:RNase adapter RapZ [Gammaproteobacteria bacterium]